MQIRYAIDVETGLVISQYNGLIAYEVLEYGYCNGHLAKIESFLWPSWSSLKWTKKIPKRVKNKHRKFWGLKPL